MSSQFACFGHLWTLELYPGGYDDETEDEMVSVYLMHHSRGEVKVEYCVTARCNEPGKRECRSRSTEEVCYSRDSTSWGEDNFVEYSQIMDTLEEGDGTLTIEVRMKLIESTDMPVPPFIPENPLCKTILNRFINEESGDISFRVCGEEGKGAKGPHKWKSFPTLFHAHCLILRDCLETFAQLGIPREDVTHLPIQITDVRPDFFITCCITSTGGGLQMTI